MQMKLSETNLLKVREKLIAKGYRLMLDKAVEIATSQKSPQAKLTAMATVYPGDHSLST